ncbi:Flp pilus assembly complex ATPase component TadA, partial [Candidatus Saccharibacteria bacterium]|nr:Flp pilus assembly complex ATPase component TadA [Candidatus Saccharibacteria bacterium]
RTIEQLITQNALLSPERLEAVKIEAAKANKTLLEYMVDSKLITDDDATKLIASSSNIPYVDLTNLSISNEILSLIPKEDALANVSVAFELKDGRLSVAMVDPQNLQAIDFISRKTGYPVNPFMSSTAQIESWINRYQSSIGTEVEEALGQEDVKKDEAKLEHFGKTDSKKLESIIQDAPITRALNSILEYAINSHASDIHIEPRETELKIRFRVDGVLQEVMTLPKTTEPALISRIKILSNLKIDEHRIPQDGQAQYRVGGKEVDLRIAIAPISFGEQVVIRLLDKSDGLLTLASLGLRGRSYELIKKGMSRPHGMILSTGPTGSGKSTTLYAVIQEIMTPKINIVTLEDPVEYKMNGVNQIQVNSEVGLTFASGLRSILRQDPNVIMVGEIRDHETADLAVQSALTGHMVLSTLHTNSASGVLPRMLDMKIEPYLIASTINTCIGQRLVRQVCEKCRKGYSASEAAVKMINKIIGDIMPKNEQEAAAKAKDLGYDHLPIYSQTAYTLYKGEGCSECQDGYKGRTGIYEVFEMNGSIEKLLLNQATTSAIQHQAQADGMITMQQDGLLKVLNGVTTLEEVARVASD